MDDDTLEVFFNESGWAYKGIYTKVGNLPGLNENEKCWTLFGALIIELLRNKHYNVVIYHDSRLVDEWYEDVEFMSRKSVTIAAKLKNEYADNFFSLRVVKLDSLSIRREQERLKLA